MIKRCLFGLSLLVLSTTSAAATWSVVAVDPETGEVGIAGASCSTGVRLIAGVVPGKGAVASQAATSFIGRDLAVEMIAEGEPATEIIKALKDEELYSSMFRARLGLLQYGVVTLNPSPGAETFSGDDIPDEAATIMGEDFSIQGNTLRPGVVDAMARAWRENSSLSCKAPLADRLLRAMEAGRNAGGDNRCPAEASSWAAFLIVASPDGDPTSPSLRLDAPRVFSWPEMTWHILAGYQPDPALPEPVGDLRQQYEKAGAKAECESDGMSR